MQSIEARIVPGHRVASGLNGDSRFPGGTIRMQMPHFAKLSLDLGGYHPATLNVSISPHFYQIVEPRVTFRSVKWHPTEPAEDFSFFDVRVTRPGNDPVSGFIYQPHPETKPEHFQNPDVLELLLPFLDGLGYGDSIHLETPAEQMRFV